MENPGHFSAEINSLLLGGDAEVDGDPLGHGEAPVFGIIPNTIDFGIASSAVAIARFCWRCVDHFWRGFRYRSRDCEKGNPMIPEAAGATPYGIFLLADAYLDAASLAAKEPRLYSQGPTRLLSYHAAELFLKTYMRSAGETIANLRDHGHDLHSMLTRAGELGLEVPPQIIAQADKMKRKNDYVRVRYVVVEEKSDISPASVLRFTTTIKQCVCKALNMDDQGVPKGEHWLGPVPSDYPGKI